jgi:hypothetical protein
MDKSRVIFPVLMGGVITLFVTAVVTIVNVGVPADFFARWMKSWALAWPAAAFIAFVSMPLVRKATERIVAALDRRG